MTTALEKLKNRERGERESRRAGKLFGWLNRHFMSISELRAERVTWREIAEAAGQDGIGISSSRADLRRLEKKWRLVVKARAAAERRSDSEAERVEDAGRKLMPSRLPRDWRPEFVDSPSNGERSGDTSGSSSREETHTSRVPVPTVTGDRKKNALTPTNPHPVASSDGEMPAALPEGKTLADIAAETIARKMKIKANRRAGYFGDK